MARRKRNRRHAAPAGGVYTPPAYTPWVPVLRPLPRFYRYPRTRAPALDQPVSAPRTVRPALIRTVRTDTTPRWQSPSRRLSPDLANRALARMQSLHAPWPSVDERPPPPRAITCARRNIRRQVLLALGRGNGSGSKGVPKSPEKCT